MSIYPITSEYLPKRSTPINFISITRDLQTYKCEKNLFRKSTVQDLRRLNICSDVFYEDLKPVLNLLRILGVLPIQRHEAGDVRFFLTSSLMVYSCCVYGGMMVLLWLVHGHELQTRRYDDSITALYHLVLQLLVFFIPFTNWRDAPRVARYVSSWPHFQEECNKVIGHPLSLSLKRRSLAMAIIVPSASTLLEVCYQLLDVSVDVMQLVTDIYLMILRVLLAALWHLLCLALERTAEVILNRFQQEVKKTEPGGVIFKYRVLWLSLAKLTRQTGTAVCSTYGFFILYMFMKLTLNVYWTINAVLFAPSKLFIVAYICITIVNDMILMFLVCNSAQLVERKVEDAFKDTLMDFRTNVTDHIIQDEVDVFLQTIDTFPPVLNLGDYVTVNRKLLVSLGSVMVTYLVVLLQFKMSNISTDGSNSNSTSVSHG